jgi:hypothetical protein
MGMTNELAGINSVRRVHGLHVDAYISRDDEGLIMKITLATLPQATEQQVFDQVSLHLLTQGRKSKKEGSAQCRYRYGQLMCAAGCLISEDEYRIEFDEGDECYWPQLAEQYLVPAAHLDLITSLQMVHDESEPERWGAKLRMVALNSNLSPAVVTNFGKQS